MHQLLPCLPLTYLLHVIDTMNYPIVTLKEDKEAGMGKEATNSISKSVHAMSTVGLKINGMIYLDYTTGKCK